MRSRFGLNALLLLVAIVLFVLAAFGVVVSDSVDLVALGLAFGFASFLVP